MRRENWAVMGLILIFAGALFLVFSYSPVYSVDYVSKSSLNNSKNYSLGIPPELSVSGYFEVGQHFFFNFTKGRFWGTNYDVNNGGMEPADPNFSPNSSILAHKIVAFDFSTASGDTIDAEVYVIGGIEPFAVIYYNQSADFTPLEGGNLTFLNVGMEGIVNRAGTYTVKAFAVTPQILKDQGISYNIADDPPLLMNLWTIVTVETKPYVLPFMSVGTVLTVAGAVSGVQAWKSKRGSRRHLKKAGI